MGTRLVVAHGVQRWGSHKGSLGGKNSEIGTGDRLRCWGQMDQKNEERPERMGAKMGAGMINDKWTLETGWNEDGDATGWDRTEREEKTRLLVDRDLGDGMGGSHWGPEWELGDRESDWRCG